MKHDCQALIIHCIDFRFGPAIKQYLEDQKLLGDVDILAVAGVAKNLVDPQNPSDTDFVIRQIGISAGLHEVKRVILMNHTDCGAYGGRSAFPSSNAESERHVLDLAGASAVIKAKYPELKISKILAEIDDNGKIGFVEIA